MKLESFVNNSWVAGGAEGRPLINPTSGVVLATADASGIDVSGAMKYARAAGGAALRDMSFAERGALLRAIADTLSANRDSYEEIARQNSGNTKVDASIDIDGGIGTLKYYSGLARKLGDAHLIAEPGQDQLARDPVFFARHFMTSRPGIAVQINAFNFPSWGLWEKIAVATLAGVPSFAKPATATALLSYQMVKDVIEAGNVPEGVLSLICGNGEALLDGVGPMDSIAFTGSAATGAMIRAHENILRSGARLNIEADSVNATIIGPDVKSGTPLFDLAVKEATKALSVKAGQLCTNIRRILVSREIVDDFAQVVAARVQTLAVGDPDSPDTRVGPLINQAQQADALGKISALSGEARVVASASLPQDVAQGSAFVAPTLLLCDDPNAGRLVHDTEVFGPCATVMPYDDLAQASQLAARAQGSLAASLFSNDPNTQIVMLNTIGAWHGRILMVDEEVGKNHTGHSIVMPQCVHGGPGRAGDGEELGGLRGLRFHMQRTAVQGSPGNLENLAGDACELAL